MSGPYLDDLVAALRLRDVPRDRVGQVVADVEAHVAATGEDPVDAFGPADEYAVRVAAGLRRPVTTGVDVLVAYPSVLGAMLVVPGVWGVLTGYRAALSLGEALAFLLLPPAAAALVGLAGRSDRSGTAWPWAGVAALVLGAVGALFAGAGVVLVRYPAWVGLTVGLILAAGGFWLMRHRGAVTAQQGRAMVPAPRRRHGTRR